MAGGRSDGWVNGRADRSAAELPPVIVSNYMSFCNQRTNWRDYVRHDAHRPDVDRANDMRVSTPEPPVCLRVPVGQSLGQSVGQSAGAARGYAGVSGGGGDGGAFE